MDSRHLSVSKARAQLPKLIDSIERTVITKNGEPAAVLLNIADFRALRAYRALARDPRGLGAALQAHERVQRGDLGGLVDLSHELRYGVEPTAGAKARYEPPRTPEERVLAGIWKDLLGLEEVGIRDDFFSLGGHSLLAVRVLTRAAQRFEVRLSLKSFLAHPTIAGQAAVIRGAMLTAAREAEAAPPMSEVAESTSDYDPDR